MALNVESRRSKVPLLEQVLNLGRYIVLISFLLMMSIIFFIFLSVVIIQSMGFWNFIFIEFRDSGVGLMCELQCVHCGNRIRISQ